MNTTNSAGEEKTLLHATVCFFLRAEKQLCEVLLCIKAAKIGVGKRLPHGGGIEPGETAEQATVREVFEESDERVIVREQDLKKIAIADFHTTKSNGSTFICRVHMFVTYVWTGEFITTKDMLDPQWYDVAHLPIADLMEADKVWLTQVLQDNTGGKEQKYFIEAQYGPRQETLLGSVTVTPVSSLPEK